MSRRSPTPKGEATRLIIQGAATALFLKQGYHATSMRQIAQRAGLALGAIYNHFASKEELFTSILIEKHPYRELLPAILAAQGETAEAFFQNAMHLIVQTLGPYPVYLNLVLIELIEFKGQHGPRLLSELAPKILPVFQQAIERYPNLRVTDPFLLLRAFLGVILSYFLTNMLIARSPLARHTSLELATYVDLFLHGILTSSPPPETPSSPEAP